MKRQPHEKPEQLPLPFTALDKAKDIIYGDREQTYGNPAKNFDCIATMWSAYLTSRFDFADQLTAKDVCYLMTLLKVARLANDPSHEDSIVDGIGYLGCAERV